MIHLIRILVHPYIANSNKILSIPHKMISPKMNIPKNPTNYSIKIQTIHNHNKINHLQNRTKRTFNK